VTDQGIGLLVDDDQASAGIIQVAGFDRFAPPGNVDSNRVLGCLG
jgi:hypothetical protein